MEKILIYVIIALALIILATIGFYIVIYHRFNSFINQDRDRINAFAQCCYDNLYDETFGIVKEETTSQDDLSPVEVKTDIVSQTADVNDDTIDNF